jgi:signal peptidase II
MSRGPSKWTVLGLVFGAGLVLDQWSKFLAVDRLTTVFERATDLSPWDRVRGFYGLRHLEALATDPHTVWQPMWRMNYVENPGAAWGLGVSLSPEVRNVLFICVSLVAAAFILGYYRRLKEGQRYLQVALALVLAGAMGNFVDRLARRYVIDFVEWYWWNHPDLRWPTFNVADSLIVVGVAMLIVHPGTAPRDASPAGAGDRA